MAEVSRAITSGRIRRQLRALRVELSHWRRVAVRRASALRPGHRSRALAAWTVRPATLGVAIGSIALIALAFALGRSLGREQAEPVSAQASTAVAAGHLTLSSSLGWQGATAPPEVAELLTATRVVAPAATDIAIVAGDLPEGRIAELFRALGLRASSAQTLEAGAVKGRIYEGVAPGADAGPATALLIPSSVGISAAVCLSGTNRTASAGDCSEALAGAGLTGAEPVSASPAETDAAAVGKLMSELNARRARDAGVLRGATTPGRQANAAQALQADYSAAASDASKLAFTALASATGRDLETQLRSAARAYETMAAAADDNSQGRYSAALRRALAADARIESALDLLTALGYGGQQG